MKDEVEEMEVRGRKGKRKDEPQMKIKEKKRTEKNQQTDRHGKKNRIAAKPMTKKKKIDRAVRETKQKTNERITVAKQYKQTNTRAQT